MKFKNTRFRLIISKHLLTDVYMAAQIIALNI